jgi:hypothetical protein
MVDSATAFFRTNYMGRGELKKTDANGTTSASTHSLCGGIWSCCAHHESDCCKS